MTAREADSEVFVVDDDLSFRRSTERLLRLAGFRVRGFGSAGGFLAGGRAERPSCLVLDVRMPDLSGLSLQRELTRAGNAIPIIFITGHGDIPMSVKAMKAGAVEFLTKPFRKQDLLEAIEQALARDRAALAEQGRLADLHGRYESLTPRSAK